MYAPIFEKRRGSFLIGRPAADASAPLSRLRGLRLRALVRARTTLAPQSLLLHLLLRLRLLLRGTARRPHASRRPRRHGRAQPAKAAPSFWKKSTTREPRTKKKKRRKNEKHEPKNWSRKEIKVSSSFFEAPLKSSRFWRRRRSSRGALLRLGHEEIRVGRRRSLAQRLVAPARHPSPHRRVRRVACGSHSGTLHLPPRHAQAFVGTVTGTYSVRRSRARGRRSARPPTRRTTTSTPLRAVAPSQAQAQAQARAQVGRTTGPRPKRSTTPHLRRRTPRMQANES